MWNIVGPQSRLRSFRFDSNTEKWDGNEYMYTHTILSSLNKLGKPPSSPHPTIVPNIWISKKTFVLNQISNSLSLVARLNRKVTSSQAQLTHVRSPLSMLNYTFFHNIDFF